MSDPLYVIPDVHGHRAKLEQALFLVRRDGGCDAPIVFLGDYVDRGPDSRGVIQMLVDGLAEARPWVILKGNHEEMMLDALAALPDLPPGARDQIRWFDADVSAETLASYGVSREDASDVILSAIPEAHLALMREARLSHTTRDLILVHAGLRPGIPLEQQTPRDLMWIRETFLQDQSDHGRLVVHGHTPVVWPEHHGNRVALDGGAGWGRALHVAVFEGRACWLLREDGRRPLQPN